MRKFCLTLVIASLIFANFNPTLAAFDVEKINIAVNQSYAQNNPDWQKNALTVIDYVNSVFAKNTNKKYEVQNFLTYNGTDFDKIILSEKYFYYNSSLPKKYGTTVFFFDPQNIDEENICQKFFGDDIGKIRINEIFSEDKVSYSVLINLKNRPELSYYNSLLGENNLDTFFSPNTFSHSVYPLVHELGHTFGIGQPEYYSFESVQNDYLPFVEIDAKDKYGNDPMFSFSNSKKPYLFSEYSADMINNNLQHQLAFDFYKNNYTNNLNIIVTDENGSAVENAQIEVFGFAEFYNVSSAQAPKIAALATGNDGMAKIKLNDNFPAYTVEATYNGKTVEEFVTMLDLQHEKAVNNSDVFKLNIRINENKKGGQHFAPQLYENNNLIILPLLI